MDILCIHCGEPWEVSMLHDTGYSSFNMARLAFFKLGCGAMMEGDTEDHEACSHVPCRDDLDTIRTLTELSGHDIDGLAADFADFGLT